MNICKRGMCFLEIRICVKFVLSVVNWHCDNTSVSFNISITLRCYKKIYTFYHVFKKFSTNYLGKPEKSFCCHLKIKVLMAIKPKGGGGFRALMARPLREELFFGGFPYPRCEQVHFKSFVYASAGTGFKISSSDTMWSTRSNLDFDSPSSLQGATQGGGVGKNCAPNPNNNEIFEIGSLPLIHQHTS